MLYTIVRSIVAMLFKILFRFKVYGRENLPKKGPFIIASNHLSFLDPPALSVASPKRLSFLAREDLFKPRLFAKLISLLGAFPIRKEIQNIEAVKEALRRLRRGEVLALFPEGRRSPNGSLGEPQGGVGLLAAKANVPIIPTLILGSDKALPRDARFIRMKNVFVRFGKPITFDNAEGVNPRKEDYLNITSRVMEEITNLSEDISYVAAKQKR